jgi:integrase/recombinase XerD
MFKESLGSKHSVDAYTWYLQKFMKFHVIKTFDDITRLDKKILQQYVELYIIQIKKEVSPNSISTYANPIKTFLEMNDIDLNWRKIKRLYPTQVKRSGGSAYSTNDVKMMLDSTNELRSKAIIHFLASTGVRIGAINEIRLRHLRDMPLGCKMITIYENSTEEYNTFLTPEATTMLNDSLDERKKHGRSMSKEERNELLIIVKQTNNTKPLDSF